MTRQRQPPKLWAIHCTRKDKSTYIKIVDAPSAQLAKDSELSADVIEVGILVALNPHLGERVIGAVVPIDLYNEYLTSAHAVKLKW